ncbi:hypothetical protein ACFLXE_04925 [Chloroflexota bacterium]
MLITSGREYLRDLMDEVISSKKIEHEKQALPVSLWKEELRPSTTLVQLGWRLA